MSTSIFLHHVRRSLSGPIVRRVGSASHPFSTRVHRTALGVAGPMRLGDVGRSDTFFVAPQQLSWSSSFSTSSPPSSSSSSSSSSSLWSDHYSTAWPSFLTSWWLSVEPKIPKGFENFFPNSFINLGRS